MISTFCCEVVDEDVDGDVREKISSIEENWMGVVCDAVDVEVMVNGCGAVVGVVEVVGMDGDGEDRREAVLG